MEEIWKDIEGYEGLYQVSNLSRVRSFNREVACRSGFTSIRKGKILKQCNDSDGYLILAFHDNGKVENKKVHRLVAIAFIPNPENKPQVNHIDGVKSNNSIDNLEWVTNQENLSHAYRLGLRVNPCLGKFGKDSPKRKKVSQFSRSGDFIAEYPSIVDAIKDTGVLLISAVCRGRRKHAGGFVWKYENK